MTDTAPKPDTELAAAAEEDLRLRQVEQVLREASDHHHRLPPRLLDEEILHRMRHRGPAEDAQGEESEDAA